MPIIGNYLKLSAMIFALSGILILQSCEKEEKEPAKSMEQLRKEEGIPIGVTVLQPQKFEKSMSFFATLSGVKEATKNSVVGGRINKIHAKIGSQVSEGKVLVEFDLDNPAVQYEQAKQAFENAKKTYERMKGLLEAGETSQQNFDNVETQYLVNKRNFESIKQMLFIEAPISGKIVNLPVDPGDDIGNGKPLFTVAQTNIMKALIWVTETELSKLKMGMPAKIEYLGEEYLGKITELGLAKDQMKNAFKVEIQFRNPGGKLKSGVTTDVYIPIYEKENAIIIQRNLVKKEGDKQFVYVENGGSAVKKYIETGEESGINVEVINGLQQGDKLITKGQSLVENGTKVKAVE